MQRLEEQNAGLGAGYRNQSPLRKAALHVRAGRDSEFRGIRSDRQIPANTQDFTIFASALELVAAESEADLTTDFLVLLARPSKYIGLRGRTGHITADQKVYISTESTRS